MWIVISALVKCYKYVCPRRSPSFSIHCNTQTHRLEPLKLTYLGTLPKQQVWALLTAVCGDTQWSSLSKRIGRTKRWKLLSQCKANCPSTFPPEVSSPNLTRKGDLRRSCAAPAKSLSRNSPPRVMKCTSAEDSILAALYTTRV